MNVYQTAIAATLLFVVSAAGTARGQTVTVPESDVRTTDLIRLATSVADALGELKVAKLKLDTLRQLSASTPVTVLEVRVAEIGVGSAEQKVGFLREIAKAELAAAEANLETLKKLVEVIKRPGVDDDAPLPAVLRAEADIAILKMILEAK